MSANFQKERDTAMRKTVLYIAMSLDGYIADNSGGVDWLAGQDKDAETEDSYPAFIREVDTVVMGWNTYHQIVTELSPTEWPYPGLTSYVITHRDLPPADGVIFTGKSPCEVVGELQQAQGKAIWICGGANIAGQLVRNDLIDEYDISVIPILLGAGVRLFEGGHREIPLQLLRTQTSNGITELVYARR